MPGRPPVPQLVLVVPVESTPVEHKRLSGLHVGRRVLIPDVAVHKTGLDLPSLALQRTQQPGDTLV